MNAVTDSDLGFVDTGSAVHRKGPQGGQDPPRSWATRGPTGRRLPALRAFRSSPLYLFFRRIHTMTPPRSWTTMPEDLQSRLTMGSCVAATDSRGVLRF